MSEAPEYDTECCCPECGEYFEVTGEVGPCWVVCPECGRDFEATVWETEGRP